MFWNTPCQSPGRGWRYSRMVEYQGLSVRSSIHRQSGMKPSATHTGTPNAPARWRPESQVMTRSMLRMMAAVL